MTTINRDEWLHALKEAGISGCDVCQDPGAMTTSQLAELWECSVDTVRARMTKLITQGLATRVTVRGGAQNRLLTAFKLKK